MPLFEYTCNHCKYQFDKMVARWDAEVKCPLCQGAVKKLMSSFAVHASPKGGTDGMPADMGPKMCSNC